MKRKIVLFDSNINYPGVPLALLTITKLLDSSIYDIRIITKTQFFDYTKEIILQCNEALCFGLTCITGESLETALSVSMEVKNYFPDLPIIWGGWQAITLPDLTLESPYVDYICTGQGERTFYEFIQCIERDDFKNLGSISGLSYKENNIIKHNPKREPEDLDNFPDFDLRLIPWEEFLDATDIGKRGLRIITSYGCNYLCGFCCEPFNAKKKWKASSASRIINLLKKIREIVQFDSLLVMDNTFFTDENRVRDICQGLIDNDFNIKIGSVNARSNELVKYHEGTWKLMKRAGLAKILIGAESADDAVLRKIHKGAKVRDTFSVVELCKEYGIMVVITVILGLPIKEYFADKERAFDIEYRGIWQFYKKLYKINQKTHVLVLPYVPLPASSMYSESIKHDFGPPKTLEEWADYDRTKIHVPWISPDKIKKIRIFNYVSMMIGVDFPLFIKTSLPLVMRMVAYPVVFISRNLAKFRLNFNFHYFPLDMWIFNGGLKIFYHLNQKLNLVKIGEPDKFFRGEK